MFLSSSTTRSLAIKFALRGYGQFHNEPRALAQLAINKDPSPMCVYNFFGDSETKACRAWFGTVDIPLREAFKQMLAEVRWNSWAGIIHLQTDFRGGSAQRNRNRAAGGRIPLSV